MKIGLAIDADTTTPGTTNFEFSIEGDGLTDADFDAISKSLEDNLNARLNPTPTNARFTLTKDGEVAVEKDAASIDYNIIGDVASAVQNTMIAKRDLHSGA
jgi:hypothetical protein